MKKLAFLLIALVSGIYQAEAQSKLLLTAGTDVPVVAAQEINAKELKESR